MEKKTIIELNIDDIEMQDACVVNRPEEPPSTLEKKCGPYRRIK
jgi:hypothetical protein